jgi:hypothetical protein
MNVINWIRGTQRCSNTRIATLVEDITLYKPILSHLLANMSTRRGIKKRT